MNKISSLAQKYHQASWRTQYQWIGLVLLGVVLIAMVAGIYISVSNRAILYGREILVLNREISYNERKNDNYEREIAELSSWENMHSRAKDLGYEQVSPTDIVYVVVPGYSGPARFSLATTSEELPESIIRPEYKETLLDWFYRRMEESASTNGGLP